MNNAQLINQTSGEIEYYTDPKIIATAKLLFRGVIHLDPASSNIANASIGALRYFGKELDGMQQPWDAENVWLNFPFGRREEPCSLECRKEHVHHDFPYYGNAAWVKKLESEYAVKRFLEGCVLTFAATSEAWFQPLIKRPQCYLSPRTNYYLPNGELKLGVTKGSVVTYYGPRVLRFAQFFEKLGEVKVSVPTSITEIFP